MLALSALLLLRLAVAADPAEVFVPEVWGGRSSGSAAGGCSGHLFGFSGLDGATNETADFVGVFSAKAYSLKFCGLAHVRELLIDGDEGDVLVATSDVLVVGYGATGNLTLAWVAGGLLAGQLPDDAVGNEISLSPRGKPWPDSACSVSTSADDSVALCMSASGAWGLGYSAESADAAVALASTATEAAFSLQAVVDLRLAPLQGLETTVPAASAAPYQQLLGKSFSVMRVNALSPEGNIETAWSTPDRTPHQWMWLWDSAFHAMGMSKWAPAGNATAGVDVAWQYLKSVLDGASSTGAISIERTPATAGGDMSGQTQPPVLSWAVLDNYQIAHDQGMSDEAALLDRLAFAAPKLAAYLAWDMANRADPTGRTPLLAWVKGTESGMDNSQRFDGKGQDECEHMLAVDFSVFLAREAACLASIYDLVGGGGGDAEQWRAVASNVSAAVHDVLWDADHGMYVDANVAANGTRSLSAARAVTGFLPMWLPDLPAGRAAAMVATLNSSDWATGVALPSVARSTPDFSTDMWRGPMWVNMNYMVALALFEAGSDAAREAALGLVRAALDCVGKNYEKYGVIFEFYDADGTHDPRFLLRKGSPEGGVRDYHWSAALAFRMIVDFGAALQGGPGRDEA